MSVTRSLCWSRIFFASSSCLSLSSVTFLSHIERNSIHCKPKSRATIEHARSKSGVISSLMTASRKGQDPPAPCEKAKPPAFFVIHEKPAISPAVPKPPSIVRLVYATCLPPPLHMFTPFRHDVQWFTASQMSGAAEKRDCRQRPARIGPGVTMSQALGAADRAASTFPEPRQSLPLGGGRPLRPRAGGGVDACHRERV